MRERTGTCVLCQTEFVALGERGPVPKLCPQHDTRKYQQWTKRHPGVPHPDFAARYCEGCGVSLAGRKADVIVCDKTCGMRTLRRRDPEGYNAKARAWQASPKGVAYRQGYQRANAKKRQSWARAARERDPERYRGYWRTWADANPELVQLTAMLRQERIVGNPDNAEVTARDIRRLIDRFRGCCAYCGQVADPVHLDHVIPVARGGRTSIGNLVPACAGCNQAKWATLLSVWRYRAGKAA